MVILGLPPLTSAVYPAHFDIEKIIRPNILALHPYRCARDDYQSGILLDANENALGHSIPSIVNGDPLLSSTLDMDLHRYPDPAQLDIKSRIAKLRGIPATDHVFLGVGSDEVIDLLMRVCVSPGKEKIMTTPPTYGMYAVCAQVNDVGIVKVPLETKDGAFQPRLTEMKRAIDADPSIKLVFLCSPGNPTGTLIPLPAIRELLEYENFKGIVVVDEAYIDFAGDNASAVALVSQFANLCVMQTLSKSFGLAAIRLGIAIAQPPLIQILTNTKAPYNISTPTAQLALAALSPAALVPMREKLAILHASRAGLLSSLTELASLGLGRALGGSHANFVLVPVLEKNGSGNPDNVRSQTVYKRLAEEMGVVVRYRGGEIGCEGCLRITVGSAEENKVLLQKLRDILSQV